MRIYSMTATFGKLNHETLTLKPGLNIVEAPNEWGKSTWCAFLVNMLYGVDTKARIGGANLVDKEHYAPWSGAPMSGRIELCWNGRDITIERSTKGRVVFGNFRAYETESGIDVPELTAANCGQMLLGVERQVFSQAGFIRLQEMPVTQNDSLRRRLNNLVTTGDENSAGDRLSAKLRDLKNKCRSNRVNGLIPQAEYERDQLREQLRDLQELKEQTRLLEETQRQQEQSIRNLENHLTALRYEASRQSGQRIADAKAECDRLRAELDGLEAECARLPSLQTAEQAQAQGQQLQAQWLELHRDEAALPDCPLPPESAQMYRDVTAEQAVEQAQAHVAQWEMLEKKCRQEKGSVWLFAGLMALSLVVLLVQQLVVHIDMPGLYIGCGALFLLGAVLLLLSITNIRKNRQALQALDNQHPGIGRDRWVSHAEQHLHTLRRYQTAYESYRSAADAVAERKAALTEATAAYAGDDSVENRRQWWDAVTQRHLALAAKSKELRSAQQHLQVLEQVVGDVDAPEFADTLTLSESDTERRLDALRADYRMTHVKLGQCIGQAETLGQEDALRARLDAVSRRLVRLEDTYEALSLAQDALYQATTSLQRRFAPRISKRAQQLFSRLTQGRYQRLTLGDDLSMNASAADEDTLRPAQWRSDGTVDQLYLALRLAVAGELTPQAPLILDDALVRFDDTRLAVALDLLQEESENKQVILFTCQSREARICNTEGEN